MKRTCRLLLGIILGLALTTSLSLLLRLTNVAAQTSPGQSEVIQAGLAYLGTQQQMDGGIMGLSRVSDPDTTARSVLAFAAAGEQMSNVISADGNSIMDYLSAQAISFTHDTTGTLFPGRAGILLSAVSLAGEDAAAFGGMDLAGELEESFQQDGAYRTTAQQGYSSGQASDLNQAWAILGLSLTGRSVPDGASQYLLQSQGEDGSWGFGDLDMTALAVTALLASHQVSAQDKAIQNALQYFHTTQLDNGGWKPSWDTEPLNADSTGWILQALVSAGEDPTRESWTGMEGNPIEAVMSLQKPDGSIGGTYANPYSTAEAILGLSGVPLPGLVSLLAESRAGLAIFSGDGTVFTACVTFEGDSISGLDLLQQSGLNMETATNPNQGAAVCKIREVGCPASDCFCSMPNYWAYWQLAENGWAYASTGADQSKVEDGNVNAWSWGSGNPPALISFQNICEGVPFVMPVATQTSMPSTDTPEPTTVPTVVPVATQTQSTSSTVTSPSTPGTYIVYGLILIVFGVLFGYLLRSRRK
jgi:hypothetical protein